MKKLLLSLASVCAIAGASPTLPRDAGHIASMLQSCSQAMALGICSIVRDENSYAPNAPGPSVAGYGVLPLIPYIRLQNQQLQMCDYAKAACDSDPSGDVCTVALVMWGSR